DLGRVLGLADHVLTRAGESRPRGAQRLFRARARRADLLAGRAGGGLQKFLGVLDDRLEIIGKLFAGLRGGLAHERAPAKGKLESCGERNANDSGAARQWRFFAARAARPRSGESYLSFTSSSDFTDSSVRARPSATRARASA